MKMKLRLDQIIVDHDIQLREATTTSVIQEYAENWENLPPIDVFKDGNKYYLADGFHRFAAGNSLRKLRIEATVHHGTKRDAILFACGANSGHGLRRTNEDKRRAVERILADEEWSTWSDNRIAKKAGVSHPFVAEIRRQVVTVTTSNAENPAKTEETRIGVDGKSYPATKPKNDENVVDVATKKTPVPAYDDSDYEDVGDIDDYEDVEEKPEPPPIKEQISKLRSVAIQHYQAAMRAVDDMHILQRDH